VAGEVIEEFYRSRGPHGATWVEKQGDFAVFYKSYGGDMPGIDADDLSALFPFFGCFGLIGLVVVLLFAPMFFELPLLLLLWPLIAWVRNISRWQKNLRVEVHRMGFYEYENQNALEEKRRLEETARDEQRQREHNILRVAYEAKRDQEQAYANAWPQRVEAAARQGFRPYPGETERDTWRFKLGSLFAPLAEFGLGWAHPANRGGTAEERRREMQYGPMDIPRRITILSKTGKLVGNIDVRGFDLIHTSSDNLVAYAKTVNGDIVGVWNFVREDYFPNKPLKNNPELQGKLDVVRDFAQAFYWRELDTDDDAGPI
jgi:hypothetical protein